MCGRRCALLALAHEAFVGKSPKKTKMVSPVALPHAGTPPLEGQGGGLSQKNGVDPDSLDSSEVPRDEPPF